LLAKAGCVRLGVVAEQETWTAPNPELAGYPAEVDRVAKIRNVFTSASSQPPSLSQLLTKVNDRMVVIDPKVLETRPVVDSYVRSGSGYRLEQNSVDLLKYLNSMGIRTQLDANAKTLQASRASTFTKQSTNEILMVAPTGFESNMQAAEDNFFMAGAKEGGLDATQPSIRRKVLEEYQGLYKVLSEDAGLKINLMSHSEGHGTPDACFPNNWFSTHVTENGGAMVLYPMKVPNRQLERREDIISMLASRGTYQNLLDMSVMEKETPPRYLEGTGCLVLDHYGKVAYVMVSERSDITVAEEWADKLGFNEVVAYHSVDRAGRPVYHTNVVQAVGSSFAVICADSVPDDKERKHLLERLSKTREVITIDYDQMEKFCGNVLEVENDKGLPVLALSTQAFEAFTPEQHKILNRHVAALHHAPIYTLEAVGGGGVRCCIAEIF